MKKTVLFLSFILIIPFCSAKEKVVYNVYFAGDLFDQKHLTGNFSLAKTIEKLSDGKYKCHLPQDWEGRENSAVNIRNRDIESVMKSDLVLFNFDGVDLDSGTVVEFMVAKALDIPCVLLRTDFRNGGYLFGDDWNLMVCGFPRSEIIKHNSIIIYNEVGIEGMHNKIATSIIESFEKVMQEKSFFNSRDEIVSAYQHVVKMCGGGLDKIINDSIIYAVVDSKIEKYIYRESFVNEKVLNAFKWIVGILKKHHVKYQLSGGLAAYLYGSKRPINDIDFDMAEDDFDLIYNDIKDFIVFGPAQYKDKFWDIKLLTLNYNGQHIDIGGAYSNKIFDNKTKKWVSSPENLSNVKMFDFYGITVPVVDVNRLIEYKTMLFRDCDKKDVEAIQRYIKSNSFKD